MFGMRLAPQRLPIVRAVLPKTRRVISKLSGILNGFFGINPQQRFSRRR